MKISIMVLSSLMLTFAASAQSGKTTYGYLTEKDQKYFKNDIMEGNNQRERIDLTVKEVNKMYAQMEAMKEDIAALKKEVAALKAAQSAPKK